MADEKRTAEKLTRLQEAVDREPTAARNHLLLGSTLLKVGRLREAEEALRRATELDPGLYEAWINIGGIRFTRWDFKGSVEAIEKAITAKPDEVTAHYNLGLGHLYLGEAEEMITCFRRVLELDPSNAGGHYHLAVGLNALGALEEAMTSLEKSRELGFSPEPALVKAIEKALKQRDDEEILAIEIGKDPDEDARTEP